MCVCIDLCVANSADCMCRTVSFYLSSCIEQCSLALHLAATRDAWYDDHVVHHHFVGAGGAGYVSAFRSPTAEGERPETARGQDGEARESATFQG